MTRKKPENLEQCYRSNEKWIKSRGVSTKYIIIINQNDEILLKRHLETSECWFGKSKDMHSKLFHLTVLIFIVTCFFASIAILLPMDHSQ